MRSTDPATAAGAFVAAGRAPSDPANADRDRRVKICGITDAAGIRAAVAAGVDAIGLNLVPGTPRALTSPRPRTSRASPAGSQVRDRTAADRRRHRRRPAERLAAIVAAVDPDVVQLSGDEPPDRGRDARPTDLEGAAPAGRGTGRGRRRSGRHDRMRRAYLAAGRCERSCSTRRVARTRAAPGRRWRRRSSRLVAREVPITLAGGLTRASWPRRSARFPRSGVDVASGVEVPRVPGGKARARTRFRVALFAKRARAARARPPDRRRRPDSGRPGPARRRRPWPLGHRPASSAAATSPRR